MELDMKSDVTEYIRGKKVEYHDETHTYYVDGIKVPSVTQIVALILPSPYKNIEPSVLKQAADLGSALHKEIELYEQEGVIGSSMEFKYYVYLKKRYQIKSIENEKLVILEHEGKIICAGRLDMILTMEGFHGLGIGDIKRTANIHMDHLKLQLNLYRLGFMQSYEKVINHLSCIHLRGFVHEIIEIPIDETYTYQAIFDYLELNES